MTSHFSIEMAWASAGQHLSATQMRTTEFAPACEASSAPVTAPAPVTVDYGSPRWARRSFTGGFPGSVFTPFRA